MLDRRERRAGDLWTRREIVTLGAAAVAGALLPSCDGASGGEDGRLLARPDAPTGSAAPGLQPLGLSAGRDGLLYVPSGYRADTPAPLVVLLHGAGGSGHGGINLLLSFADANGLVLLAPDSRGGTWDIVLGAFGPDVRFIDRALGAVFGECAIDPARVAIGGFSDGASYALSLGLTNGDLFSRIIAFSPGFMAPATTRGTPEVFVSHGTNDPVLSIDLTSREIVTALARAGYAVEYQEFDGGHAVPAAIAEAAVRWLMAGWG